MVNTIVISDYYIAGFVILHMVRQSMGQAAEHVARAAGIVFTLLNRPR